MVEVAEGDPEEFEESVKESYSTASQFHKLRLLIHYSSSGDPSKMEIITLFEKVVNACPSGKFLAFLPKAVEAKKYQEFKAENAHTYLNSLTSLIQMEKSQDLLATHAGSDIAPKFMGFLLDMHTKVCTRHAYGMRIE